MLQSNNDWVNTNSDGSDQQVIEKCRQEANRNRALKSPMTYILKSQVKSHYDLKYNSI